MHDSAAACHKWRASSIRVRPACVKRISSRSACAIALPGAERSHFLFLSTRNRDIINTQYLEALDQQNHYKLPNGLNESHQDPVKRSRL